MSNAFRAQAQQLAQQVITDVRQQQPRQQQEQAEQEPKPEPGQQPQPRDQVALVPSIVEPGDVSTGSEPQAYHEESRQSEFGTKHIDPDTGLIYFKYDFGYEFGVLLPGAPQKVDKVESSIGQAGSVELPVLHERTGMTPSPQPGSGDVGAGSSKKKEVPSFQPKKFTTLFKPAKWEPVTDSEVSDRDEGRIAGQPSRYYEERKPTYMQFRPAELVGRRSPSVSSISPMPSGSFFNKNVQKFALYFYSGPSCFCFFFPKNRLRRSSCCWTRPRREAR